MTALIVLAGLSGACATHRSEPAAVQPTTLTEIVGEYRIVRFGSYRAKTSAGVWGPSQSLNIGNRHIVAHIGCNAMEGPILFHFEEGLVLETEDLLVTTAGCGDERIHRREDALAALLVDPFKVVRLADGRLRLTGTGPDLILEPEEAARRRQAPRRFSSIEGDWYVKMGFDGRQAVYPDATLPPVEIEREGLRFAGCPFRSGPLSISDAGELISGSAPIRRGGCVLMQEIATGEIVSVDPPSILFELLPNDVALERTQAGDLVMSRSGKRLVLSRRRGTP
ncbi:hypothetical protein [uncultured Algimonas sp.]|uniref:hypothetical protein n=1 Tax=uncultured Algimonas sp. TaxID=1547920 RepID=UPI00263093AE|nr:hypothetical protein [uncultured Algimonas sp.]